MSGTEVSKVLSSFKMHENSKIEEEGPINADREEDASEGCDKEPDEEFNSRESSRI